MKRISVFLFAAGAWAQSVDLAPVISKPISRTVELPGEILAFLAVPIHAKVRGYVEHIVVDRGSVVKQGDLLAELSAPEMKAQIAETESRIQSARSDQVQAEAQLAAAQSNLDFLKKAAETPGAVAGSEVIQASKQVDAAVALVQSRQQAEQAAEAAARAQKDLEAYLRITAPFDGIITERFVHPGALVGPGADPVIVTLEQLSRLRVTVAVPEEDVGGIVKGAQVQFRVPAFPERTYSGTVARISHALDLKSRTMAVELDAANRDGSLAPGMYPSVQWPVRRSRPGLFVPKTSVVTTTERIFVIRDQNGRAEWVDVTKGPADGDLIEVSGKLKSGDHVVRRATDEIREGAQLPK